MTETLHPQGSLKPCPWCSGTDIKMYDHGLKDDYSLSCLSCGDQSGCMPTKAEAITLWNTRASQDAIRKETP